jgi:hypothetical protein
MMTLLWESRQGPSSYFEMSGDASVWTMSESREAYSLGYYVA